MSPTFKTEKGYRFFTWSKEENRKHVHVSKDDNIVKIWLEPNIEIAENKGFSEKELNKIIKIVNENEKEFNSKWIEHFS